MHGGRVEVASPGPGLGSTFSVHLPNPVALMVRPEPRSASEPTETTLNGVRVLIVEDDPDAREIAERTILDAGGSATVAGSATEALAALANGSAAPDVLVSDIGLPGTDGYALLRAVRALPHGRGALPAIAVTAYASESDAQAAKTRGFSAHITKPYMPATLVDAVRNAVGHRTA
jgi:CheY-like chemotaxis protein